MKHFISWGGGVQSTAMAVMSVLGDLPQVDAVIHSDTGFERTKTVEIVAWYSGWLSRRGQEVIVCRGRNKITDNNEHMHMPFWTTSGGPLRRQCTREFKLVPLKRAMREFSGFDKSLPPHPGKGAFDVWLGITWDETERMKKSRVGYMINSWPLIEKRLTRNDCIDYLENKGLPVPVKSACVGCPYRDARTWQEMKVDETPDYRTAVNFDKLIRHSLTGRGVNENLYVWRKEIPLGEVDFVEQSKKQRKAKQLPLFCHGYCGV